MFRPTAIIRSVKPAALGVLLFFCCTVAISAESTCAPIRFDGATITCIKSGLGSIAAQDRASLIERRLVKLADDLTFNVDSISVSESEGSYQISAGDLVIASLRPIDIDLPDHETLGGEVRKIAERLKLGISSYRAKAAPQAILAGALKALLATIGLVLVLWLLKFVFSNIEKKLKFSQGRWIRSITFNGFELLNSSRIAGAFSAAASFARFVFTALTLYIYVPLVFSFFPWTSGWAPQLYGYISHPLIKIGTTVVELIPNFFFIAVIFFLTRYVLRVVQFFFAEVEKGHVKLEGFYTEWSSPTYKLIRVIIVAFAFVMAFPYIPGSSSPAFQGISVFLGLLLSLGSSSAIGNVVAGLVITYMRPFRIGDRVQIGETVGDVTEKNLLVTRLRTIKNVDVTIPNAIVLASHITNFSSHASAEGLIIHTSVTIGYDVPWVKIHQLLIGAAEKTEGIDQNKKPFVLQTALSDFFVEYEINAYTTQASRMATITSSLHQNIQDEFNAANVEIMSPHYASLRDGNKVTIPILNLPT